MFRTIDLYLGRTLLSTTFITLFVLVGLSSLIKFVEQLKYLDRGNYDMTTAGIYVLLSVPRELEQFFPMAALIGGLVGMGMLASHSELVVMQAAGQSRLNLVGSAMKSAALMALCVMAIGEWVAPPSEAKAKEIRTQAISGGSLFSSERLVWAKDGDDFVSLGEVANKDELRDVSIYRFDEQLQLASIERAERAIFVEDHWQLENVYRTRFTEQKITQTFDTQLHWQSGLTPDKLGVVKVKPEALSIAGLSDYLNYLQANSQDARRYQLAFWRKVLQPVTVAVMLLVALSFIFGPLRSVTMGARIIMGVLTGFGFFVANEVFGPLSMVYQMPAVVGAIAPSLLFAGMAVYLIRR
ncbi:Lipopolysaccharide export system permease protein LptG [Saliniradius amylolyticus]|uniref:Lipopolysaccharide export system permease protein LptG n=1 Tax=Saliniradius amylolyticus TaxID=2183582 RepID=A0A2S2E7E7_9ALTE|nr:LPS export ABC transporter permease LptG [Saliniradius amylolyticus]AWL13150.1 Lipopolysaccharide export system permease protein LptG [Saliniradius amylolyticus]